MYAGTVLNLTCDYNLSPLVDAIPQIAVTWMVDGVAVDTSSGRIFTDGALLSFSPVATSDDGNYMCTLTVTTSQAYASIQGVIQSTATSINIRGNYSLFKKHELQTSLPLFQPQISHIFL